MLHRRRVVITGMGVVAANGVGIGDFWDTLIRGESGIGFITLFPAEGHPCRIAGEVKNFSLNSILGSEVKAAKHFSRQSQLALAATQLALKDARLDVSSRSEHSRTPVVLGISTSSIDTIEKAMELMERKGVHRVPATTVGGCQPHQAASGICQVFPGLVSATTVSSACAAGLDAIGAAALMIRSGKVDAVVAGGADAPITALTFACMARAGLVPVSNGDPASASRPFDRKRESGVISEGAGVVVLEEMDHALARGARPVAEITGFASNMDVDPEAPAGGLAESMSEALANAGRRVVEVDYICAHGPGHPVVDRMETAMIKKVFGQRAYTIPVSSIKGVTGNALAGSGGQQVIAAALAIRHGLIPPTANYVYRDPDCDLDYVAGSARRADLRCVLVNMHGLGGGNSTMILEKVEC